MDKDVAVMMLKSKSMGVAFALTLFFGPLGMFYSTVIGGVVMLVLFVLAFILSIMTLGFGIVVYIPLWIVCVIWTIISVNSHNNNLFYEANSASSKGSSTANVKKCPKCAEIVNREAVVCKHCGADVSSQTEQILVNRNICPKCKKDYSVYVVTCGDCDIPLVKA